MMRTAGATGAVGIEVLLALGVGFYGGKYLDERFHTDPWLQWTLSIAGIGAAIKALVRTVRIYQKSLQDDEGAPQNPNQPPPS